MTPVRFSNLKHFARSALHFQHSIREPLEATPAMRIGTLVHQIVLGGAPPLVWDGTRRGKAWDEFKAANCGREIFTQSELERARAVASAVLENFIAEPYLIGTTEKRIVWGNGDVPCAGTPDVVGADFVADLKTTSDASPNKFRWQALQMAYHAQLAWYRDGLEMGGHATVSRCIIVAVETKAPYGVTVHELSTGAIESGRRLYSTWLELYRVCRDTGHWPGYGQSILELDIPEQTEFTIEDEGENAA